MSALNGMTASLVRGHMSRLSPAFRFAATAISDSPSLAIDRTLSAVATALLSSPRSAVSGLSAHILEPIISSTPALLSFTKVSLFALSAIMMAPGIYEGVCNEAFQKIYACFPSRGELDRADHRRRAQARYRIAFKVITAIGLILISSKLPLRGVSSIQATLICLPAIIANYAQVHRPEYRSVHSIWSDVSHMPITPDLLEVIETIAFSIIIVGLFLTSFALEQVGDLQTLYSYGYMIAFMAKYPALSFTSAGEVLQQPGKHLYLEGWTDLFDYFGRGLALYFHYRLLCRGDFKSIFIVASTFELIRDLYRDYIPAVLMLADQDEGFVQMDEEALEIDELDQ